MFMSVCPTIHVQRVRVMCLAQRVMQVWGRVYRTKGATPLTASAWACCFFMVDASICPDLVAAGKTHPSDFLRISRMVSTRGDAGMRRLEPFRLVEEAPIQDEPIDGSQRVRR